MAESPPGAVPSLEDVEANEEQNREIGILRSVISLSRSRARPAQPLLLCYQAKNSLSRPWNAHRDTKVDFLSRPTAFIRDPPVHQHPHLLSSSSQPETRHHHPNHLLPAPAPLRQRASLLKARITCTEVSMIGLPLTSRRGAVLSLYFHRPLPSGPQSNRIPQLLPPPQNSGSNTPSAARAN